MKNTREVMSETDVEQSLEEYIDELIQDQPTKLELLDKKQTLEEWSAISNIGFIEEDDGEQYEIDIEENYTIVLNVMGCLGYL
jgi:hypothetical protein